MPGLIIRPRSRILHGHDWVYASEVQKAFGEIHDGDVVSLKDGKDRLLGSAIYNSKSQIIARRFSRQRQDLDADFFRRRIRQAVDYRLERGLAKIAGRLVWSESDGLPGVIVDRYGDVVVLQTLTLAMERAKPLIVAALKEILAPRCIVERNDAPGRKPEGLESIVGMLHGPEPGVIEIEVAGLRLLVDPLHGQKTGFYLDQTSNYAAVARRAAGKRVLDCFSNAGSFALACARAGATSVVAVEISGEAVAHGKRQAERNDLASAIIWHEVNAFDFLAGEEKRNAQYDLIILDPPSFTKGKGNVTDALRGYKELHLRALKMLAPGGSLATFSCSHHIGDGHFRAMISEASLDAKRALRVIERYPQAADHPVMLWMPETEYLHGYLFELLPGR